MAILTLIAGLTGTFFTLFGVPTVIHHVLYPPVIDHSLSTDEVVSLTYINVQEILLNLEDAALQDAYDYAKLKITECYDLFHTYETS